MNWAVRCMLEQNRITHTQSLRHTFLFFWFWRPPCIDTMPCHGIIIIIIIVDSLLFSFITRMEFKQIEFLLNAKPYSSDGSTEYLRGMVYMKLRLNGKVIKWRPKWKQQNLSPFFAISCYVHWTMKRKSILNAMNVLMIIIIDNICE